MEKILLLDTNLYMYKFLEFKQSYTVISFFDARGLNLDHFDIFNIFFSILALLKM